MNNKWQNGIVLISLLAVALGAGCNRNVMVTAEGIGGRSIEVNLIGVSDTEFHRWTTTSMAQYWQPGNPMRENAKKYVMRFGRDLPQQQILKKNDPIWRVWSKRKAKHLFVLADLRGGFKDAPGNADPRRLILPIYKCWKWHQDTIAVQLESNGVNCFTLPECKDWHIPESR